MKKLIFNVILLLLIAIIGFQAVVYTFNFINPWLAILIVAITVLVAIKFSDKIIK